MKYRLHLTLCGLAIALSYLIVLLPETVAIDLLKEDGGIETATVVFFLFAVFFFSGAAGGLRSRRDARLSPVCYAVLALLMFACAGEEISWGQRIFHWATSGRWAVLNAQHETNLHNLVVVEGYVRPGMSHGLLRSLTNANRLFALFWMFWFVAVPLATRLFGKCRSAFAHYGVPIAPGWCGALFVVNYLSFRLADLALEGFNDNSPVPLDELKECNYALVYATIGIAAFVGVRQPQLATGRVREWRESREATPSP